MWSPQVRTTNQTNRPMFYRPTDVSSYSDIFGAPKTDTLLIFGYWTTKNRIPFLNKVHKEIPRVIDPFLQKVHKKAKGAGLLLHKVNKATLRVTAPLLQKLFKETPRVSNILLQKVNKESPHVTD